LVHIHDVFGKGHRDSPRDARTDVNEKGAENRGGFPAPNIGQSDAWQLSV
jgi:hypothetical protein